MNLIVKGETPFEENISIYKYDFIINTIKPNFGPFQAAVRSRRAETF